MCVPKCTLLLASLTCVALLTTTAAESQRDLLDLLGYVRATCVMQVNSRLSDELQAANNVQGTVSFEQLVTGGPVTVTVSLTGLDTSGAVDHGFHVHESDDFTDGCQSTGGHFNPHHMDHGGREDSVRHVGDFGNVGRSPDGSVEEEFTDGVASLVGTYSIIGKSIVLHKDTDDLGKGVHSDSRTTGHAGARLACCRINQV